MKSNMTQPFPFPRYIALDLDGTLLTKDKQVDPRTRAALDACRQRGCRLIFVTGRTFEKSEAYLRLLRPDAAVLSYGAHVLADGKTVFRRYMSARVGDRLMRGLKNARYIRFQQEGGACFTDRPGEDGLPLDRAAPVPRRLDHLCAWDVPAEQAVLLARRARCSLTQLCGSRWCSFAALGCDKGSGLKRALAFLSLPAGCGIGFGDEDCDIAFFRVCGAGAAMANADERTLRAADWVTQSNEDQGIARFIERHILGRGSGAEGATGC